MTKTPNDLVQVSILPRSEKDGERLELAIRSIAKRNPSSAWTDRESSSAILRGASQADIDVKVDSIKRICGIDCKVGPPRVIFRKTIARAIEIDYTHKKHFGGTGEFARTKLVVAPNEPGDGFEFKSQIVGGAIPAEYIPAIENGLKKAIGGSELDVVPVDIKVRLVDGAFHDVDSSAAAFEIASSGALLDAFRQSGSLLLEPIMKVEIATPADHTRLIVEDLASRRGSIMDRSVLGDAVLVHAMVPLANMFGYDGELSTLSEGQAVCTMQFDHYERTPAEDPDPPFRPAAAIKLASGGAV
ncbi:hypothetical protein [Rhizobium leguminosarum]|uniref:hypothetical protein n=1 Tax=Rhizobium leguminosarum TaxID=384 RepID=UPI000FEC3372|nr:hypothetical protein [Rhizobium leguminosarum]RWX21359.1 hypothetical protein EHI43_37955 [Rhizobium leguminosarum]